jgi:hypothetical protein
LIAVKEYLQLREELVTVAEGGYKGAETWLQLGSNSWNAQGISSTSFIMCYTVADSTDLYLHFSSTDPTLAVHCITSRSTFLAFLTFLISGQ